MTEAVPNRQGQRQRIDFHRVQQRTIPKSGPTVLANMSSPAVEGLVDHVLEASDEDSIVYVVLQISELVGVGGPKTVKTCAKKILRFFTFVRTHDVRKEDSDPAEPDSLFQRVAMALYAETPKGFYEQTYVRFAGRETRNAMDISFSRIPAVQHPQVYTRRHQHLEQARAIRPGCCGEWQMHISYEDPAPRRLYEPPVETPISSRSLRTARLAPLQIAEVNGACRLFRL